MQNKKQVSTETTIITIMFLALFIIMPPLCRVLYPRDETAKGKITGQKGDLPGLTCIKEYGTIGYSLTSQSSFKNGQIKGNILTATKEEVSVNDDGTAEQTEFDELFNNIANTLDQSKKETNELYTKIQLDSNYQNHWQSKNDLRAYYEELGFTCTDSDNTPNLKNTASREITNDVPEQTPQENNQPEEETTGETAPETPGLG